MKEITVFCYGDSTKIRTWSNVPYFFTLTLENKGLLVNRVDISPNDFFSKIFQYTFNVFLKLIYRRNSFDYKRSSFFKIEANYKIGKAVEKYPNSDAFIFLNYDFSTVKFCNKPSIQFGDWTYEHYVKYFLNKNANFFEKQFIERQNKRIYESTLVFTLFPGVADQMRKKYNSKIIYLGNVINSIHNPEKLELLALKAKSNKILFIGNSKYIEGAKILLIAYSSLKERISDLSLDFIGLKESELGVLPENVTCHGYLDKGIEKQSETYYNLLKNAKIFVNTTPKWSSFSASIEAMHFFTPVIVPAYHEFVNTFGENFDGGCYCNSEQDLFNKLLFIFSTNDYEKICIKAHELVQEFTWDSYIDKMLKEIYSVI